MTDHQRGDSVLDDNPCITPNTDRIKKNGVTFSEAFCPSPHCCPARATFFTGLYPTQHGIWHNVAVGNAITRSLNEGVRTWSEDFREAGYRMMYSGKWHVSHTQSPVDCGWDVCPSTGGDYSGKLPGNHWPNFEKLAQQPPRGERREAEIDMPGYPDFLLYGTRELPPEPKGDSRVVREAVEAMDALCAEDSDEPWCLYAGCIGPHDPYFVPQRFLDMYDINDIKLPESYKDKMEDKPGFYRKTRDIFDQLSEDEARQAVRHFLAYCTFEDELFGRLLDKLEELGEADNTIVIYCSDHGDYNGEHGLWAKGVPCFRGAYHVPLVMQWPAGTTEPGRVVDELVSLADVAPTLMEAAGIPVEREMVGESLMPFMKNEQPDDWRDKMYTQTNGNELYAIQRAVFTKERKMVYNGFDYSELYDLEKDPHEMVNRIDDPEYADDVRRMMSDIWRFARDTGDTCINPYIMVRFAPYGPAVAFE
jgi:arylsulfatase A-like enzyme